MTNTKKQPIILFDGYCNLCSRSVQTVIKYDPKARFKMASLQSEVGQKLLKQFNTDNTNLTTFILIEDGKVYKKSTAALKVARKMSGLWPILMLFMPVPRFIRDAVYEFISRNRYKWFGKRTACWLPNPSLSDRFID